MKYYKVGSIVEVRVNDKFCNDVWRCAEIVSRNGHNYTVSYDVYPGFTDKEDVEHLSGKFIRPCPPILELSERWLPGDEVEVFHDLSWKMAIVLEDCSWDGYLVVRVVGSLEELEVTESELRVPLSYQNGEWVDADGAKRYYGGLLSKENAALLDFHLKDICFDDQNNHNLKESGIVSSKTRKRASPCCYTPDKENEERPLKFRMSGKEGRRLIVLGTSTEKVMTVMQSLLVNLDTMKTLGFTMEAQRLIMETLINLTPMRHGRMKFVDESCMHIVLHWRLYMHQDH